MSTEVNKFGLLDNNPFYLLRYKHNENDPGITVEGIFPNMPKKAEFDFGLYTLSMAQFANLVFEENFTKEQYELFGEKVFGTLLELVDLTYDNRNAGAFSLSDELSAKRKIFKKYTHASLDDEMKFLKLLQKWKYESR